MLSKSENAKLNKDLKALVNRYKQDYEIARKASEDRYKTTLKPGEVFRAKQGFYFDDDRQIFKEKVADKLKAEAHELIKLAALELSTLNTKAPDTEAVNVLSVLNARQNVSADEIDELMTKYGLECPMIYKAMREKAESLGYHDFKPHPVSEKAEDMDAFSRVIDSTFDVYRAENNLISSVAAYEVTADRCFPVEE